MAIAGELRDPALVDFFSSLKKRKKATMLRVMHDLRSRSRRGHEMSLDEIEKRVKRLDYALVGKTADDIAKDFSEITRRKEHADDLIDALGKKKGEHARRVTFDLHRSVTRLDELLDKTQRRAESTFADLVARFDQHMQESQSMLDAAEARKSLAGARNALTESKKLVKFVTSDTDGIKNAERTLQYAESSLRKSEQGSRKLPQPVADSESADDEDHRIVSALNSIRDKAVTIGHDVANVAVGALSLEDFDKALRSLLVMDGACNRHYDDIDRLFRDADTGPPTVATEHPVWGHAIFAAVGAVQNAQTSIHKKIGEIEAEKKKRASADSVPVAEKKKQASADSDVVDQGTVTYADAAVQYAEQLLRDSDDMLKAASSDPNGKGQKNIAEISTSLPYMRQHSINVRDSIEKLELKATGATQKAILVQLQMLNAIAKKLYDNHQQADSILAGLQAQEDKKKQPKKGEDATASLKKAVEEAKLIVKEAEKLEKEVKELARLPYDSRGHFSNIQEAEDRWNEMVRLVREVTKVVEAGNAASAGEVGDVVNLRVVKVNVEAINARVESALERMKDARMIKTPAILEKYDAKQVCSYAKSLNDYVEFRQPSVMRVERTIYDYDRKMVDGNEFLQFVQVSSQDSKGRTDRTGFLFPTNGGHMAYAVEDNGTVHCEYIEADKVNERMKVIHERPVFKYSAISGTENSSFGVFVELVDKKLDKQRKRAVIFNNNDNLNKIRDIVRGWIPHGMYSTATQTVVYDKMAFEALFEIVNSSDPSKKIPRDKALDLVFYIDILLGNYDKALKQRIQGLPDVLSKYVRKLDITPEVMLEQKSKQKGSVQQGIVCAVNNVMQHTNAIDGWYEGVQKIQIRNIDMKDYGAVSRAIETALRNLKFHANVRIMDKQDAIHNASWIYNELGVLAGIIRVTTHEEGDIVRGANFLSFPIIREQTSTGTGFKQVTKFYAIGSNLATSQKKADDVDLYTQLRRFVGNSECCLAVSKKRADPTIATEYLMVSKAVQSDSAGSGYTTTETFYGIYLNGIADSKEQAAVGPTIATTIIDPIVALGQSRNRALHELGFGEFLTVSMKPSFEPVVTWNELEVRGDGHCFFRAVIRSAAAKLDAYAKMGKSSGRLNEVAKLIGSEVVKNYKNDEYARINSSASDTVEIRRLSHVAMISLSESEASWKNLRLSVKEDPKASLDRSEKGYNTAVDDKWTDDLGWAYEADIAATCTALGVPIAVMSRAQEHPANSTWTVWVPHLGSVGDTNDTEVIYVASKVPKQTGPTSGHAVTYPNHFVALSYNYDNIMKAAGGKDERPLEQGAKDSGRLAAHDVRLTGSRPGIVESIRKLDELFCMYEVNPKYEWKVGPLSPKLKDLSVPQRDYGWHGGMSFCRIVAQYAAKNGLDASDFTVSSTWSIENAPKSPPRDHASYYTYALTNALMEQNFGSLFTSQPNFDHKPIDEYNYNREYTGIKPDCSSATISKIVEHEETIEMGEVNRAVEFVERLIQASVLIKRKYPSPVWSYGDTLRELDTRLSNIKEQETKTTNINNYTGGGAGPSTGYGPMLRQSLDCFAAFLPMIEHKIKSNNPSITDDELSARALSYGCVSHGLDPRHLIAVRYTMVVRPDLLKSYRAHSVASGLFDLQETMPITRELMRTRMLGSIVAIDQVKSRQSFGTVMRHAARRELPGIPRPVPVRRCTSFGAYVSHAAKAHDRVPYAGHMARYR